MQNENSNIKNDVKARAYKFALDVIEFCEHLKASKSTRILENQLLRASTSVGANLVEARASTSRLEYKKFFEIALKSANESIYWLELIRDAKLSLDSRLLKKLTQEATEISRMIGKSVITLKSKKL